MTPEVAGSKPAPCAKLYVVVRSDLEPGAQACQAAHVVAAACCGHEAVRRWQAHSQVLVLLAGPAEPDLVALATQARDRGLCVTSFREPDWGDPLTAVAILGDGARRLLSSLPLALRGA